jgi:DNA gyrase inhibitor GyrI
MRVASVHGFGESPEPVAWEKLIAWAKPKGYLDDLAKHRLFGFNNPNPSPDNPNYGYELWMVLGEGAEEEDEVEIREFPGGLYAVTRCKGVGNIFATWQRFAQWCKASQYQGASHQWLEESFNTIDTPPEEMVFDLYLPISV